LLLPILYALIVLYFVDQLRLLASLQPVWGRLIFGAEMLGGTLFLIWLMWSKQSSATGGGSIQLYPGAVRLTIQISLIVFTITFLANVLGYVNFANLLGGGALRSAYVGAAVYTGLRIVQGLIIISLGTRPLSLIRAVRLNRQMLERRICGLTAFLAFVYWASLTLSFFGLRAPLIAGTEEVLQANLAIGALNISLRQILVFLATIWAAFALPAFSVGRRHLSPLASRARYSASDFSGGSLRGFTHWVFRRLSRPWC
jgi:hypothetical protein